MRNEALSSDYLQATWAQLNQRYFRNALPPIPITWSSRLTASMGIFYSRSGPRTRDTHAGNPDLERRVIRLSLPLFRQLYQDRRQGDEALTATLAHEMIHQWQYDILKRRPNHGVDFRRMLNQMNQDGLGITIYHSLEREIDALARYVWRCRECGYTYRRRRRTIQPRRHRCGACRGPLQELERHAPEQRAPSSYNQLALDFSS